MIRGNEGAIDLGLSVLEACSPPKQIHDSGTLVSICDEARNVLGLSGKPLTRQDFWFLEHRALAKLQREMVRRHPELREMVLRKANIGTPSVGKYERTLPA